MAWPGGTWLNQIADWAIRQELEQYYALVVGWLSHEHKEDGSHAAITADSITTTGNITADGTGTFDGNVIADADGSPATIGAVGSGTSLDSLVPIAGIDLNPSSAIYPRVAMAVGRSSFKELVWQWWDATNGWLTPLQLRDDTSLGGFSFKPGPNTNGFKGVYLGSSTDGGAGGYWAAAYAKKFYRSDYTAAQGEWTSYTPTWDSQLGTPVTVGNATITGRYTQVGKIVFFDIVWSFGSTSAQGAGNIFRWSLPVTANDTTGAFTAWLTDSGTQHYVCTGYMPDTSHVYVVQDGNTGSGIGAGTPMAWATGDAVRITGHYRAA